MAPLKPYLYEANGSLYIRDFPAFVDSSDAEPITSQTKWSTSNDDFIRYVFPSKPETGHIFVFNKQRSSQRVCPSCYRLYHVGDHPVGRPKWEHVTESVRAEQIKTGLCSDACVKALGKCESKSRGDDTPITECRERESHTAMLDFYNINGGVKLLKLTHDQQDAVQDLMRF